MIIWMKRGQDHTNSSAPEWRGATTTFKGTVRSFSPMVFSIYLIILLTFRVEGDTLVFTLNSNSHKYVMSLLTMFPISYVMTLYITR